MMMCAAAPPTRQEATKANKVIQSQKAYSFFMVNYRTSRSGIGSIQLFRRSTIQRTRLSNKLCCFSWLHHRRDDEFANRVAYDENARSDNPSETQLNDFFQRVFDHYLVLVFQTFDYSAHHFHNAFVFGVCWHDV